MFDTQPDILSQPHVPKPLHGLNPRTILGQSWWDIVRERAYQSTDYHCLACGVHKSEAKQHKWLEAHELWNIDYTTGICTVNDIVPLCHYCHNFIHRGRLYMIMGKEKSIENVKDILGNGLKILADNKLKAFYFTIDFAKSLGISTYGIKKWKPKENPKLLWNDYKLILDGKEYTSRFLDEKKHRDFYLKND
jgi:hypothetical protein